MKHGSSAPGSEVIFKGSVFSGFLEWPWLFFGEMQIEEETVKVIKITPVTGFFSWSFLKGWRRNMCPHWS